MSRTQEQVPEQLKYHSARQFLPEASKLVTLRARNVVMDWSECSLVESKPDVQRGRPVLKGTRMPVDDIVENWEAGLEEPEIAINFRLPLEQVKAILAYAAAHKDAPHPVR